MVPFKYGRVVSGPDFCGRQNLISELSEYFRSAQNIAVLGERRIGKTSLIVETARKLKGERSLLIIDLMAIKSAQDIYERIVKSVLKLEKGEGFLRKLLKVVSHLRPVIGIDPNTNALTVSLDSSNRVSPISLEEALDLVEKLNAHNKLIVFFDEFQEVLNCPGQKEILAVLRSKIQYHEHVAYVFAGSIRSRMDEIFNHPDSPFFNSAIPLTISEIDRKEFSRFIQKKFRAGERTIKQPALNKIFDYAEGISGDIQKLCEALWSVSDRGDIIDDKHILEGFDLIFAREQQSYELILIDLTKIQTRCLYGLAKADGYAVTGKSFLKSTGIEQPSSVKRAIALLEKKRMIFRYKKQYRFVNPFLKSWLIQKEL
jgi:uncharacterized protein